MHQAKLQQKEKCMEVLSPSHLRFNCLMEVSGCEAFRLGQEQALLDPSARVFVVPDDYDALNQIENKNCDLEYYVSKENLIVNFVEELEDETETQGGGSQASKSNHSDLMTKDQAESKSKAITSGGASDLEGCLEIPTGLSTSSVFDDNLVISFTPLILQSPEFQILDFLDKNKTPQSRPPQTGSASEAAGLGIV